MVFKPRSIFLIFPADFQHVSVYYHEGETRAGGDRHSCDSGNYEPSMICPHCSTIVQFTWHSSDPVQNSGDETTGSEIVYSACPNCSEIVIYLKKGRICYQDYGTSYVDSSIANILVYPKKNNLSSSEAIPNSYLDDYQEAIDVLPSSAKASAALSRKLIQTLFREQFEIQEKTFSKEIDRFIEKEGVPPYLKEAMEALRKLAQLKENQQKDKATAEIVSVDFGEAEWLIEISEVLFDFAFIQPAKLERKKDELNAKRRKLGKGSID